MRHEPKHDTLSAAFVLGQWTRVLIHSLAQAGVADVVVSPGSRSTPLVLTALRHPHLTCHSVIDERAAAFFALGIAQSSRRPVVLICTSGSAVAHYLPALIEAHQAGLPLLTLTADRPSWLQGSGAPQTIDQTHVFGRFAQDLGPLGEPSARFDALRALARKARQSVALATGASPGPVHLNFPVDKPLEPASALSDEEREFEATVTALLFAPPSLTAAQASISDTFSSEWLAQARGKDLLVLGPVDASTARAAREVAELSGLPLLSEYPQGGDSFPLEYLGDLLSGRDAPERILHIGPPAVSGHYSRAVAQTSAELWALPGPRLIDPESRAARVFLGDLGSALGALRAAYADSSGGSKPPLPSEFAAAWRGHAQRLSEHLSQAQARDSAERADAQTPSEGAVSEIAVSAVVLGALPPSAHLLLANSLSVRVASWCGAKTQARLWFRRGANGIDGSIAEATGLAVNTREPTVLLLGDVAAVHDLSSLALARRVKTPLVLVLMDNSGGRLFDLLPAAKSDISAEEWAHWRTPPEVDFLALAQAHGLASMRATSLAELHQGMKEALVHPQSTVIVIETDPSKTAKAVSKMKESLSW